MPRVSSCCAAIAISCFASSVYCLHQHSSQQIVCAPFRRWSPALWPGRISLRSIASASASVQRDVDFGQIHQRVES